MQRKHPGAGSIDFESLARHVVRAVRGARTQTETSALLGSRTNVVHRWEVGRAWPSAARFLQLAEQCDRRAHQIRDVFFARTPNLRWKFPFASHMGVAEFLRSLAGKTPRSRIATSAGIGIDRVFRYLNGRAEPNLPTFLLLIETLSRRVLDFLSTFVDVERLPSVGHHFIRLERARELAYESPWSQALLRAMELDPKRPWKSSRWLASRLGLPLDFVRSQLDALCSSGQVTARRGRFRAEDAISLDTSRDSERARALKLAWSEAALNRLHAGQRGHFGYSLFSVSTDDLVRLRDLHLEYLRAMQQLIRSSTSPDRVALYCVQLLDLCEGPDNVFGVRDDWAAPARPETTRTAG